jgi:hypothetical protein
MAREIPEVVRAAAGLAATVLDEARKLPETLPGLPVRIIGLAMQSAMKVQQQYAGFVARGDELFIGLRGQNEPGLATFDDEEPAAAPAPSNGFRDSAFDRAGETFPADDTLTGVEVESLPAAPEADAVTAVVDELADQVETGQQSIEELAEEAPAIEEILDELAIDDLVDRAPTLEETAPTLSLVEDAAAPDSPVEAEPTADVSTTVDVLTAEGEIATVDAAVTDEGVAAPETAETEATETTAPAESTETPATDTNGGPATAMDESGSDVAAATGVRTDEGGSDTAEEDAAIAQGAAIDAIGEASAAPTDEPEGGSELSGSQAAGTAPVDGYDSFSIAQLRGRLRGYALSTVQDLVAYEEATRAREPYLRMLRNRLEKLEEQAVEASPLAPRGV